MVAAVVFEIKGIYLDVVSRSGKTYDIGSRKLQGRWHQALARDGMPEHKSMYRSRLDLIHGVHDSIPL